MVRCVVTPIFSRQEAILFCSVMSLWNEAKQDVFHPAKRCGCQILYRVFLRVECWLFRAPQRIDAALAGTEPAHATFFYVSSMIPFLIQPSHYIYGNVFHELLWLDCVMELSWSGAG